MRRAAALLCLLYAITCGVFWVRSYWVKDQVSFSTFAGHTTFVSRYGRLGVEIHPTGDLNGSIGSIFWFRSHRSWPINAEDVKAYYPECGDWLGFFNSRVRGFLVPAWFSTGVLILLAVALSFAPRLLAMFRRKPTDPPTPPPGG